MMLIFKRCCCCSLRAGCLTIAIVSIIFDLLNIAILLGSLVVESETLDSVASLKKISFEDNDYTDARFSKPLEEPEWINNIQVGLESMDVLLSLISVVTSSLLIFGICQSRYKFIFPTLLWMPLDFAIYLVSIVVIFLFDVYQLNNYVIIVEIVLNLSLSLLCWLFVFSFWQQVKIQVGAPQRIEMETSNVQD
jgi:hypothetical protein